MTSRSLCCFAKRAAATVDGQPYPLPTARPFRFVVATGLCLAAVALSLVRAEGGEAAQRLIPPARKLADHLRDSIEAGDAYATPSGIRRLRRLAGAITIGPEAARAQTEARLTAPTQPLAGYARKTLLAGTVRLFEASPSEKLRHLRERTALSSTLERARQTRAGRSANPVFVDPATGLRLLATDRIVVRLKAGIEAKAYFGPAWPHARPAWGTTNEFILSLPGATAERVFGEVDHLSRDPQVEWAEPDFISEAIKSFVPNDPYFAPRQWHLNNTGQSGGSPGADAKLLEAWDSTTGRSDVVIAFLDDGLQINHPDLAANVFQNAGEVPDNGIDDDLNGFRDDVHGWDFVRSDSDPSPEDREDNHGTAVAGIAGAVGDNDLGVVGAAFGCRILPLKVISGEFSVSSSGIARAMRYAAGLGPTGSPAWRGADVINLSLIFSPGLIAESAFQDAVSKGRGGRGCPIFVAAGNAASAWEPVDYYVATPGTYTLRWEYTKDESDFPPFGDDTVWLDSITWSDGTRETFEAGLPAGWTTSAGAPWTAVTDGVDGNHALLGWNGPGSHALRAGPIPHNQTTYVETTRFLPAGPMRSWIWVSSEFGYDFCRFKVNGVEQFRESGVPILTPQVDYPANLPEAIAVGASTDFDYRSDYSQYGPKLDFLAPSDGGAAGTFTTDRTGANGYSDGTRDDADYTRGFGGTSSATPLASGVAALVLSLNPYLTASDVRALLRSTCDQIGGVGYDAAGRNTFYGSGRINAARAVQATKPDLSITLSASANPATQGDITTYTLTVRNHGLARSGPLIVSNRLPSNVSFGSATPAPSGQSGNSLILAGPTLASGGLAEFRVTVTNLSPGADLVLATVSNDLPEPNLNDNSASLGTTVLPVPAISVSDAQGTEGSAGNPGRLFFNVTLDQPGSRTISVAYTTVTNTAGRLDFRAAGDTLTFPPGQVAAQIAVNAIPDALDEDDEIFFVRLSKPVNAVLGQAEATGTILDDDDPPSLFSSAITVRESSGPRPATFLLRLSAPSGRPVAADFNLQAGTAAAGLDFVPTNGTLIFPPGKTLRRFVVSVLGDAVYEGTESFDLQLRNPTNATLAQSHYPCTIVDHDRPPKLFVDDTVVTEGDSVVDAVFHLRLSGPAAVPVSCGFLLTNGSASAGADFMDTNGVVTFLPGETNQLVTIPVQGDLLSESNEFFSLRLVHPTNATLADAIGRATIIDNDPLPSLTILDAGVVENAVGPTNAVFDVLLSPVSGKTVSVKFATAGGTAAARADFVPKSGLLIFPPGTTNRSVVVTVNRDTLAESDEIFFANLSVPINTTLVRAQAVGTIFATTPENAPVVRITDVRFSNGTFSLRFVTEANRRYQVECSNDGVNPDAWMPLPGVETIGGDGGTAEILDPETEARPKRFYRIRILP